jgi:hypothetical protein
MLVDRRLLPTADIAISGRVTVFDRVSFWLLSRGAKKTVRGKPRGVNSVFLVQLRKMAGGKLWIGTSREIFIDVSLGRVQGASCASRRVGSRGVRDAG